MSKIKIVKETNKRIPEWAGYYITVDEHIECSFCGKDVDENLKKANEYYKSAKERLEDTYQSVYETILEEEFNYKS